MYTIQRAAEILGRSKSTVQRWMKVLGIRVVNVYTDAKRVYIADADMDLLVDHLTQKVVSDVKKTRKYHRPRDVITTGEGKFYSFAGAALLLGVSVISVKRWSMQDGMPQKFLISGRKRWYIPHDDLFHIAELHRLRIAPNALAEISAQREVNATQTNMDKLCSTKEVALYLDIAHNTAKKWIREARIEFKTKFMGKEARYITYGDVVRLAELPRCEVLPDALPLSVREEIEVLKGSEGGPGSD